MTLEREPENHWDPEQTNLNPKHFSAFDRPLYILDWQHVNAVLHTANKIYETRQFKSTYIERRQYILVPCLCCLTFKSVCLRKRPCVRINILVQVKPFIQQWILFVPCSLSRWTQQHLITSRWQYRKCLEEWGQCYLRHYF